MGWCGSRIGWGMKSRIGVRIGAGAVSACLLVLHAGCASAPRHADAGPQPRPEVPEPDLSPIEGVGLSDMMTQSLSGLDGYEEDMKAQRDRALANMNAATDESAPPEGEAAGGSTVRITRVEPAEEAAPDTDAPDEAVAAETETEEAEPVPPDPTELYKEAARTLAQQASERLVGSLDPLRDALLIAAIQGTVDGSGTWLSERALLGLTPDERQAVKAFEQAISEINGGENPAEAFRIASEILGEESALRVARARLCSRVDGFGRYQPFSKDTFLAGRTLRAIVYSEIDGFRAQPTSVDGGDPGWEVRLSQELLLYHDADGTLAWRLAPRTSRYTSRTRPRDYFIVNQVALPPTLTIGSYKLKVVTTDDATGAVDEAIIPIQVVADPKLARKP